MNASLFEACLRVLRQWPGRRKAPVMRLRALRGRDPFRIAVGTILSARVRDGTLERVLQPLFRLIRGPRDILAMRRGRLESLLHPLGFFRTKARALLEFARAILRDHGGQVPDTLQELLELRGIGIKVAGIILVEAFGQDAVSVDTHVHRISNRLGLVNTRTPEKTCAELYRLLPRRAWRHVNINLVALGQLVCQPLRPRCGECPIQRECPKVGVNRRPNADR